MEKLRDFRAVLCHRRAVRPLAIAVAIAIAIAGCGGALEASIDDRPVPDASATGCPRDSDIDTGAALGGACAPDGTYCSNPSCDPCTKTCPAVRCTQGVWASAVNTAQCTSSDDASTGPDVGSDARACVEIDPSSFDQTCTTDSDCLLVTAGTFCSGEPWCACGVAAINADDQSRYQQQLQELSRLTPGPRGCSCPFFGRPTCVGKQCVLCGGASMTPGCPDAG